MRRTKDLTAAEATGWTLTGFGAGLLAGALLAGWVGAGGTRRARRAWQGWRTRGPSAPSTATTAAGARAALTRSDLKQYQLRVIGVGPGSVELHGWVPSRLMRAQAERIVARAGGVNRITNAILVRGEDDRSPRLHRSAEQGA